jgi:hypothetical protein
VFLHSDTREEERFLKSRVQLVRDMRPEVGARRRQRCDFDWRQVVSDIPEFSERRRRVSNKCRSERLVCDQSANQDFDASMRHCDAAFLDGIGGQGERQHRGLAASSRTSVDSVN